MNLRNAMNTYARKFIHKHRARSLITSAEEDPASLWWPSLCNAAALVRNTGDHALYARLLAAYDPTLPLQPVSGSEFVGSGGGNGTLSAYRRVSINGQIFFEKVYQTGAQAHRRCLWFYEAIAPRLEGKLRFPRLVNVHTGRRISVLNFEYCPGAQIQHENFFTVSMAALRALLALDIHKDECLMRKSFAADPRITDFRSELSYTNEREAALSAALTSTIAGKILDLEILATDSGQVFGHGDLAPKNIFSSGEVADWDTAGFFPIGYDAAILAVSEGRFDEGFSNRSRRYTESLRADLTSDKDFPAFMRNFSFFCFIHMSRMLDYPPQKHQRDNIVAFRDAAFQEALRWA